MMNHHRMGFGILVWLVLLSSRVQGYQRQWRNPSLRMKRGHDHLIAVDECVKPAYAEGTYVFGSDGSPDTCGLFLTAPPDHLILVQFEMIQVSCSDGLVAFFDGWEMGGRVVPSQADHPSPMKHRIHEFCGESPDKLPLGAFRSSQNVALIQYRVPKPGDGFIVKVSHIKNPHPCHVVMTEMSGHFTVTNHGNHHGNCTLTTMLFPATFEIFDSSIGSVDETDNKKGCGKDDLLEVGGSADLESTDLEVRTEACGQLRGQHLTVLCGSSTLRLVSSGQHSNWVSVLAREARPEDIMNTDSSRATLACRDFL